MKYSKMKLAQEALRHKGFLQKIPAVFRMLKAWKNGIYKIKIIDILLPAIALIYVISPIDLIPDFIPVVGVIDDLAILAFAIPMLLKEVDKFLMWEFQRASSHKSPTIIDAEIVE
ncbi:YkvA family protein [Chryseobacterium sp. T1]